MRWDKLDRLVLASGNAGKQREIAALVQPLGVGVVMQSEFSLTPVSETGTTFVENALLKARHACEHSGLPALADDSGLIVDALGGAPGIRSARYAGNDATDADNRAKLLQSLAGVAEEQRVARFHCSLVLLRSPQDPAPLICEGNWHGCIAQAPRGEGGFGYDPVFLVPGLNRTAAELDPVEKNRLSHRGQALAALISRLSHN